MSVNLQYWADGVPLITPGLYNTLGVDYWADGAPYLILETPSSWTYAGSISVSITPAAIIARDFLYAGSVAVTITPAATYSYQKMVFTYAGSIAVSITPAALYTFYQFFTFTYTAASIPVSITPAGLFAQVRVYSGSIGVSIAPAGVYFRTRFYDGSIPVTITPAGEYALQQPAEHIYAGDISVSITPAAETCRTRFYTGSIPVTITPAAVTHPEWTYLGASIPVSISPAGEYAQSIHIYVGAIPVSITPAADTLRTRYYDGSIPVSITPAATYSHIQTIYTYAGNIPVSTTPASLFSLVVPSHTYLGNIPVTITPAALYVSTLFIASANIFVVIYVHGITAGTLHTYTANIPVSILPAAIYAFRQPKNVTGSGGVKVEGYGNPTFITPGTHATVGSGGVGVGGSGVVEEILPGSLDVVGDGGVKVAGDGLITKEYAKTLDVIGDGGVVPSGAGVVAFVSPPSPLAIIGTGGVVISSHSLITPSAPGVLAVVGSGGVKVGYFRAIPAWLVQPIGGLDLIGSGGVIVGGDVLPTLVLPMIIEIPGPPAGQDVTLKVGGGGIMSFSYPPILQVTGEGGIEVSENEDDDGGYETWVLTGNEHEPSIYTGFNFNSYATFQGRYYAAGPDGLYLLEGEDDDGVEIHDGVRIGPFNLSTDRIKRLRSLRLGQCEEGATVRVVATGGRVGTQEGFFEVEDGRAPISRDMQGREFMIDVADFGELSQAEIVALVLSRR